MTKVRWIKQLAVGVTLGGVLSAPVQAAPTFNIGALNTIGFDGVGNSTGTGFNLGDTLYGIVSVSNIRSGGTTQWNADNTAPAPYDNFTGYFAAEIIGVSTTVVPGPAPFGGNYTAVTLGALQAGDTDPNGVFTPDGQTVLKFYTDTLDAFETDGTPTDDISKVTNGTPWASLGFTSDGGFWTMTDAPNIGGTNGAMNFVSNNTGLSWAKVTTGTTGCAIGCEMVFESSFKPNSTGGWSVAITDPADLHPVPLPAAAWLLVSGLGGLFGIASRRKKPV